MMKENLRNERDCILCGSESYEILHYYPKEYYNHKQYIKYSWDGGHKIDFQVVKCNKCGLVYLNPSFTEESLHYLYPTSIIPENLTYNNLIKNHNFNFLIKPIIGKIYKMPLKSKVNMIDIGTRYGVLPELLSKKGFNAFGIEYNKKCVEVAHKNGIKNIYQGKLQDIEKISNELKISNFNLVTLIDVIEHLINPLEELRLISKFQKKGDRMIITTMNLDSLGYKIFKEDWHYIHNQHMFYFNKKTIEKLFHKLSYEIEYVSNTKKLIDLIIIPKLIMNWFKHKIRRDNFHNINEKKEWFAKHRPHFFDLFTIVFKHK